MNWNEFIPVEEITNQVTAKTVDFAKRFGEFLGKDDKADRNGRQITERDKLTTNQLRKFFGEVKRQQMKGYDVTDFVLLKPKLAYAVSRAKGNNPKIKDFYEVMSNAIDQVNDEKSFRNFIKIFEAIVAYHKATEENKL
ncbi:MAG: type III-A CRISPR-associated protein Csm2 [Bacteroidales bacterium]|nr:type III-A CRISPR-associated protein Csm2 [Bacteroidales bacterium]